jgi:flavodoxin
MADLRAISRRAALSAPAAMLLAGGGAGAAEEGDAARRGQRALVAYFTRSGNTRVIAGQLKRDLGAELFEIRPSRPYPEDYEQTVEQARQERDSGFEPALEAQVADISAYDVVFLGFPIWGETAPPVIRSFLTAHDLSDKAIRPFITHGGFGPGNSLSVLKSHAPRAQVLEPFVMEADQERRTMNQVRGWLATFQRAEAR